MSYPQPPEGFEPDEPEPTDTEKLSRLKADMRALSDEMERRRNALVVDACSRWIASRRDAPAGMADDLVSCFAEGKLDIR